MLFRSDERVRPNLAQHGGDIEIEKLEDVEQYKDLLDGTIPYGFPACCGIEELRERMDREHIRVFVIDSSLGLCGFVLAKEVELQCQSLLIK